MTIRVCSHGTLARKCEICELIEAEREADVLSSWMVYQNPQAAWRAISIIKFSKRPGRKKAEAGE